MIVIVGKSGQLSKELHYTKRDRQVICLGRDDINVYDYSQLNYQLSFHNPTILINASAYTSVDKAESNINAAYSLNFLAVKNMAEFCKKNKVRLIHISTDFVFDGKKNQPYESSDQTNPLNIYGASKLAGEHAIQSIMEGDYAIVRTSWLYSSFCSNFVKSMLSLMAQKNNLNIVKDQVGTPTYARGLANFVWLLTEKVNLKSIFHYSDNSPVSWYEFACEIRRIGTIHGLVNPVVDINPIPTEDYPTPALRPKYSCLKSDYISSNDWRYHLSDCLVAIKEDLNV